MDRQQDTVSLRCEFADGFRYSCRDIAKIFASMAGEQDVVADRWQWTVCEHIHRVDDGIAGHDDFAGSAFSEQIVASTQARSEVKMCDLPDRPPVRLFGKRAIGPAGAQASFDMAYWNRCISRGLSACKSRVGIALHQDNLRLSIAKICCSR